MEVNLMQSITDFGAIPNPLNSIAPFIDSYAAFQAAADTGKPTLIPAGVGAFYISQPIICRANSTDRYKAGMKFIGEDRDNSIVWSGCTNDAVFKFDASIPYVPLNSIVDATLSNFSITPAPETVAKHAVMMTSLQYLESKLLRVEKFSSHGIYVPWRSDLNPTLSDLYQCLRLCFTDPYVRDCGGDGFRFAAGQSPGLWSINGGEVRLNKGSGILTTTGQFNLSHCVISENVQHGLDIDPTIGTGIPIEGPAMCGDVVGCEFDSNLRYQLVARHSQCLVVRSNRFLTPPNQIYGRHLVLGLNGYGTCTGGKFNQNYHRSTGSNEVICYLREPNSNNNLIENPFFGPSSSNNIKYYGFTTGQGNKIIQDNVQIVGP